MDEDNFFMNIALELAKKGMGYVSPNPMVGAVIVKNGLIAGKGYHRKAGTEHAEIAALKEAGKNAKGSTLYVTLEPCCHFGKTPPCTDAIIRSGVKSVVYATTDKNPLVCGFGCAELREKGVETRSGILENETLKLNESYFKYITTGMPFVTLKLAVTLDGKISDTEGNSRWITGPETRKFVHSLRAASDAIMVGSGTILKDDPLLDVRGVQGRNPLKVIVDSSLSVSPDSKVFSGAPAIVAVTEEADSEKIKYFVSKGIDILSFHASQGQIALQELMYKLGNKEITSVLCEGGSNLAASLVNEKLVDKFIFTFGPKILGNGLGAFSGLKINKLTEALNLKDIKTDIIDRDVIVTGYPEYV